VTLPVAPVERVVPGACTLAPLLVVGVVGRRVIGHGADATVYSHLRKWVCEIRKRSHGVPEQPSDIDGIVRARLRTLRLTREWSLDTLAAASNLSASTLSRIETGKRAISLDVLIPLARALQVDLDELLSVESSDDVVIRPIPSETGSRTTWMLTRPTSASQAIKMRLEAHSPPTDKRVHPGRDWFFVLAGTVRLRLGDRTMLVAAGEAAEFDTMTPHAFDADGDEAAEVIVIFDRDGRRAHTHYGD
jgi:transcriptional regulator with XRE-family HTH domain